MSLHVEIKLAWNLGGTQVRWEYSSFPTPCCIKPWLVNDTLNLGLVKECQVLDSSTPSLVISINSNYHKPVKQHFCLYFIGHLVGSQRLMQHLAMPNAIRASLLHPLSYIPHTAFTPELYLIVYIYIIYPGPGLQPSTLISFFHCHLNNSFLCYCSLSWT